MDQINLRPACTVDRFSEDFGVGRSTIYAEIRAGRLPAFKVGDRTLIAGEDALAWRNRHREAGYHKAPSPKRAA
jgi:excisionase family DNA binding protein